MTTPDPDPRRAARVRTRKTRLRRRLREAQRNGTATPDADLDAYSQVAAAWVDALAAEHTAAELTLGIDPAARPAATAAGLILWAKDVLHAQRDADSIIATWTHIREMLDDPGIPQTLAEAVGHIPDHYAADPGGQADQAGGYL